MVEHPHISDTYYTILQRILVFLTCEYLFFTTSDSVALGGGGGGGGVSLLFLCIFLSCLSFVYPLYLYIYL